MKFRNLILVAAVCLLAFAMAASAADPTPSPMKPGKWEVTVQMDMPGMQMPPRTFTRCVTTEDAQNAENAVPKMRGAEGCKMTEFRVEGSTLTWKMNCEQHQSSADGKLVFDNDSYTGEVHVKAPDHEMTMKHTGKRVGDCNQ